MEINDIRVVKENLRTKYKNKRMLISRKKKLNMDANIHSRLFSLEEYLRCSTIFTYVSKDIEVNTLPIITSAISFGKNVAVPKCSKNEISMDFYFIKSLDDLSLGMFGVLEPNTEKCEKVLSFGSESLCIVPGFSFDMRGYRIGYGKGYYDRFLVDFQGCTVGLCYDNCIKDRLPNGKFDKPVNFVVTNKFIRRTN